MDSPQYPCDQIIDSRLGIGGPIETECGAESHVLEYESGSNDEPEDYYVMRCQAGHTWYYIDDSETWK